MYTITPAGKQYFDETVRKEMGNFVRDYFHFDIGIGLGTFIPLAEKISLAEKRIEQLSERLTTVHNEIENYGESYHSPFPRWILLDHERAFLKTEISWLSRYIKLISDCEKNQSAINRK